MKQHDSLESTAPGDGVIVGAGPAGLMPAAELRLAGIRPVVLERKSQRRGTPNEVPVR
ncbi:FAD-dependent monooxygenase [Nocardia spumae]|uniref:FAD-dependent monooxygenase n=1 Tax=Nocardia spumae TaxID=2887190 RepID=UPI003FD7EB0E